MPTLIAAPTRIEAAGTKPKEIDEYVGRVNTGAGNLSVAHMRSPSGWAEPGQTPEFDEYTVVIKGAIQVEHEGGVLTVEAGQAVSPMPASGFGTPRRDRMAPNTSPFACLPFRPAQYTGTPISTALDLADMAPLTGVR